MQPTVKDGQDGQHGALKKGGSRFGHVRTKAKRVEAA
jgi:hypothetical protein